MEEDERVEVLRSAFHKVWYSTSGSGDFFALLKLQNTMTVDHIMTLVKSFQMHCI